MYSTFKNESVAGVQFSVVGQFFKLIHRIPIKNYFSMFQCIYFSFGDQFHGFIYMKLGKA